MVALWQLGVRVVLPLSLAGASQEERTERLARFNSIVLSRALLVLYLVRAECCMRHWLRLLHPHAPPPPRCQVYPGVSVASACSALVCAPACALQQPALTQHLLPPRTTSFRDLQLHDGTRHRTALLVLPCACGCG